MQFKISKVLFLLVPIVIGGFIFTLINVRIVHAAAIECPGECRSLTSGCLANEFAIGTGMPLCGGGLGLDLCCGKKSTGQTTTPDDCSGFCVPMNQCAPGTWPAPALSDPSAKGSCKSVPNAVCCGQQIVTPEGQAPGTAAADAAASGTAAAKQADKPIGAGCVEKSTGLVVPCVAQGSPTQVIVAIVARVVNWLLTLSGTLLLVMFVWGGISYMIAGGDSAKAAKAQKTLVNAIIGIGIIMFSYVILDYLFGSFVGAL